MGLAESWIETEPDGAVITGSQLDDYERQTKRAVRERLEGDPANLLTGIYEIGSFAAAPMPRAGSARLYVGTDAAIQATVAGSRQDGRMGFATDTKRLYHVGAAAVVEIGYMSTSGPNTQTQVSSRNPSYLVRDSAATALAANALFAANGTQIVVQSHNSNARFAAVSYAAPSQFIGYRANGDSAAPTQIVNGSTIASFHGRGYTSAPAWTTAGAAGLEIVGTEAWTGAANGAKVIIFVTANGGAVTTTALTLNQDTTAAFNSTVSSTGFLGNATTATTATNLSGGTVAGTTGSFSTSLAVAATARIYLDGIAATGDTYIVESSANVLGLVAGGTTALQLSTTFVAPQLDVALNATKKLYLDGGGDTYIQENSANVLWFVAGGGASYGLRITNLQVNVGAGHDFSVDATAKLFLDGAGDTYIYESSANRMDFVAGGTTGLVVTASLVFIGGATNFAVDPTKKIYLDGGSDTYILEASANYVRIITGGAIALGVNATGVEVTATNKLWLDGGGDTYIYEASANELRAIAGGTTRLVLNSRIELPNSDVWIDTTRKLYLDGGGDTYIGEESANQIYLVVGANRALTLNATLISFGGAQNVSIPSLSKFYLDGAGDTYIVESAANTMDFYAGGTKTATFGQSGIAGAVAFPNHSTTASAANAVLDAATGNLARFTSSLRYKKDVTDLTYDEAAKLIFGSRAVVYSSKSSVDDPKARYLGFIAEEIDLLDKRVVSYLKGKPDAVGYDRFVAPLSLLVKAQHEEIQSLKARVQQLESQLAK